MYSQCQNLINNYKRLKQTKNCKLDIEIILTKTDILSTLLVCTIPIQNNLTQKGVTL